MMDIEDRVRHTLHELADTVPTTADPRSEVLARIAERRRVSRPALVAVAAAAVIAVAGIAIPLAVDRDHAEPPAAEPKKDNLVWSSNYDWLDAEVGPFVLGTTKDLEPIDAVAWVRDGESCIGEGHHIAAGAPAGHDPAALVNVTCNPVPTFPFSYPEHPEIKEYLQSWGVLSDAGPHSGPFKNLMFFVTSPQVAELEVGDGAGEPVSVRLLDATATARYYLAEFPATSAGFRYTATDANGNVLTSAIE